MSSFRLTRTSTDAPGVRSLGQKEFIEDVNPQIDQVDAVLSADGEAP
jgi:hypothetical protein